MTKAEIIRKTEKIIAERRNTAQTVARQALKDAMGDEKFASLEKQYRILSCQIAKDRAYGNEKTEDVEAAKKLLSAKNNRLKELKIDLNPKYVCQKCDDTGYDKKGSPCSCYRRIYQKLLKKSCNLNSLADFTFENSRIPENAKQYDSLKLFYDKMENFCEQFPMTKNKVYILSGEMGTGKTCLTSAVANSILERGFSVLYLTAFELNDLFLKYHTGAREYRAILTDVLECNLLIIDDLGTEKVFLNVTIEYLFNVINIRLNNNRHIIISTNLDENEILDRYGERIYSRLSAKNNTFHYRITGDDLRKK